MAEFTSRDKTIATLLNFGLLLVFAAVIIFVDEFRTVDRLGSSVQSYAKTDGILAFEIIWFASLAVSAAILLWGHRVRAMLLHCSPPWLALASHWSFCTIAGSLGFVLYMLNMVVVVTIPELVLSILQGGFLGCAFTVMCLVGVIRPLPEK